jgi:DMSO/TMAO reductase YedYZ molybdopterin-dependent catalytic subunit
MEGRAAARAAAERRACAGGPLHRLPLRGQLPEPHGPNERYYESIDLFDAFHPQTILAYDFNGGTLPVAYGAPVRLRVERQLGYKHAKYVMRVQAVNSLAGIGMGKGGYWEDHAGYQWYAGI